MARSSTARRAALAIGATLVFALVASDVDLVFCDLPHVPPGAMGCFLLTQMASVAELEAGLISERVSRSNFAAFRPYVTMLPSRVKNVGDNFCLNARCYSFVLLTRITEDPSPPAMICSSPSLRSRASEYLDVPQ